jgi:hypothetical protein
MNSFEEYTLMIGLLAVLLEGLRHLKEKFHAWLHQHSGK